MTDKEIEKLRDKVQPYLDALYQEHSEHDTCHQDFGCIIESKTFWVKLEALLSQEKKKDHKRIIKKMDIVFSQYSGLGPIYDELLAELENEG